MLVRPVTVAEAVAGMAADGAVALAGGTDLMNGMRLGHVDPPIVVDLGGVAELRRLAIAGGVLTIGAAVTMRQLLADAAAVAAAPAVADAARLLGGRQIQSSATFGGNVCNASPAAETATPLLAVGATAHVSGGAGPRSIPIAELWTGPGRTSLAPGELLVALTIPVEPGTASAYRRLELRRSVDIALVSASAWVRIADGVVADARVAIGAAAPTPRLVPEATAALVGAAAGAADAIDRAAGAAAAASTPITDHRATADYRTAMVAEVARRAIANAFTSVLSDRSGRPGLT